MIYVKTQAGRQALKERAESMPRKFHFPFMMCDGVRDSEDILHANAAHGFTSADLERMIQLGFIAPLSAQAAVAEKTSPPARSVAPPEPVKPISNAALFIEAQQMATALTANLGLRGFRLNMAVEAALTLESLAELFPKIEAAVGKPQSERLAKLLKIAGG